MACFCGGEKRSSWSRSHSDSDRNMSTIQTIIWILLRILGQVLYLDTGLVGATALLNWLKRLD